MTLTRRILRTFPRIPKFLLRYVFATIDLPARNFSSAVSCRCSVGSSFNVSCIDTCRGGASCSNTEDGCGFLGWYSCNGWCRHSVDEPLGPPES